MDTAVKFYEGVARGFEQIEVGIRTSTMPIFKELDKGMTAKRVPEINGAQTCFMVMPLPNGDNVLLGFGNDEDGKVALMVALKASDMKTLAALVDVASAVLCGLDGVSLVEGWANQ